MILFPDRDVHEGIERVRGEFPGRELRLPDLRERLVQVVGAISVVVCHAEPLVAVDVACRDDGVVDRPRRDVLDERQDRAAVVGDQAVRHGGDDFVDERARVRHGHVLETGTAGGDRHGKGPGIHDLAAVGVDDAHILAFGQPSGLPVRGWDELERRGAEVECGFGRRGHDDYYVVVSFRAVQ